MNRKQKQFTKIFISLFVVSFILINWEQVSWLFNYREMSGLVHGFFNPYQESDILVSANTKLTAIREQQLVIAPPVTTKLYPYSERENSIQIPVIGVDAPVIIGQSTDKTLLSNDLDKGAVYYPGSVLPAQNGQIVVLGHSAPANWPKIKYDYIFTHIEGLAIGSEIILNFNNRQYTYRVLNKKIIKPGQDVGSAELSGTNNILTLISCWPPGKDYQRIAVTAELVPI